MRLRRRGQLHCRIAVSYTHLDVYKRQYLDAVVQRSFTNDDEALLGPIPTFSNGIPIGPYSPLEGARPFRRAPHTGFFVATYSKGKLTGLFNAAFASRSDDSTYLEYEDVNGGNSLLLPNRNLDHLSLIHIYKRGISLDESIKAAQLEEKRRSRVGGLSGGQKQRLAMACALVGDCLLYTSRCV